MGTMHGIAMATVVALLIGGSPGVAWAKHKKAATPAAAKTPHKAVNACGCYADATGKCFCTKRGKCDCPGECEPKGCEEKRSQQMRKEVAAETKRAEDADRKARQSEGKDGDLPKDEARTKPRPLDKDGVGQ
jgi:hypothetical protein